MEKQEIQEKIREKLLNRAREETDSPGVYLMKDERGAVLYVGKAKALKNRLVSYFQPARHESSRIEMLVAQIRDFELILTKTEAEALILECSLIKKHKPRFNVRLRDDKSYPYIKIDHGRDYPRLEWTRRVKPSEEVEYFGPFPSAWSAKQAMELLNVSFQLRDCSENTFRHRSRPCVLHQIERCSAPCVERISQENYHQTIHEVSRILQGNSTEFLAELEEKMHAAAEQEEFEKAASYRDHIKNLRLVTETQGIQTFSRQGVILDRDVIGVERNERDAQGTLLKIRGGKLQSVEQFHFFNSDESVSHSEVILSFIHQHYVGQANEKLHVLIPSETDGVSLEKEFSSQISVIEEGLDIQILFPEVKEDFRVLDLARSNAQHALSQRKKQFGGHGVGALEEIQKKLQLDRLPHRIECYDNSNLQGEDAVASRVVFIDGAPEKSLYRRYKIKTVEGANDFATMKEVLGRRFLNSKDDFPDLVVVDGGVGQLNQAVKISEELNIQGVAFVGLAKARVKRNFQSKDVEASEERIFIPNRKNPIKLAPSSPSFRLLTHVRDEAHRFAIQYHRKIRDKRSLDPKSSE